jgi:serpin B
MTWAGARGETKEEMTRAMHLLGTESEVATAARSLTTALNALNDGTTTLHVASGLFGEKTCKLEPGFLELTTQRFGASVQPMDFLNAAEAARKAINARLAKQTNRRISELLPAKSLDETTKLVLTNTVYFLGKWRSPFEHGRTQPRDFYVNGRDAQKVPMMSQRAEFGHSRADGVQVLEMSYKGKGNDVGMLFVLPNERNGLEELEQALTTERLENWVKTLQPKEVAVQLPRFQLRSATPLRHPLKLLGMELAFEPGKADFTGMSACGQLVLEDVYHQAIVKVDEQGTEAAAATAPHMQAVSRPRNQFIADHPFLFVIRHRPSGTLLFLGRVVSPAA